MREYEISHRITETPRVNTIICQFCHSRSRLVLAFLGTASNAGKGGHKAWFYRMLTLLPPLVFHAMHTTLFTPCSRNFSAVCRFLVLKKMKSCLRFWPFMEASEIQEGWNRERGREHGLGGTRNLLTGTFVFHCVVCYSQGSFVRESRVRVESRYHSRPAAPFLS